MVECRQQQDLFAMIDQTRTIETVAAELADAAAGLRYHLSQTDQPGIAFAGAVGVDVLVQELQSALHQNQPAGGN